MSATLGRRRVVRRLERRTNVYASVAGPDAPSLYRYLTTRVAALPGVQGVETAPVIRTVKAAGTHHRAR